MGNLVAADMRDRGRSLSVAGRGCFVVLLRLAYLGVANALTMLCLLPISDRAKGSWISSISDIRSASCSGSCTVRRSGSPADRALLSALLHRTPLGLQRHRHRGELVSGVLGEQPAQPGEPGQVVVDPGSGPDSARLVDQRYVVMPPAQSIPQRPSLLQSSFRRRSVHTKPQKPARRPNGQRSTARHPTSRQRSSDRRGVTL
jgi:hypothetical protein